MKRYVGGMKPHLIVLLLQVATNGIISFREPFFSFSIAPFPNTLASMIAPFWADVDTRSSSDTPPAGVSREDIGKVWYREEFSGELLEKAGQEIREAFVDASDFVPTSLFIATWRNVGYNNRKIDKARTAKFL